jgi:hypothetical protein
MLSIYLNFIEEKFEKSYFITKIKLVFIKKKKKKKKIHK